MSRVHSPYLAIKKIIAITREIYQIKNNNNLDIILAEGIYDFDTNGKEGIMVEIITD